MTEPSWLDPTLKGGAMVRAALWLQQVVGPGNVFTKKDLREAFPGIEQVDRRVRDLRGFGWVIHTNQLDKSLNPEELRFVGPGAAVWIPSERRGALQQSQGLSNAERTSALAANDFQCVWCGIAGGEAYPEDATETAVLSVSRPRADEDTQARIGRAIVECKRCRAGGTRKSWDKARVVEKIAELDATERDRLVAWVRQGVRTPAPADLLWSLIRVLPKDEQEALLKADATS